MKHDCLIDPRFLVKLIVPSSLSFVEGTKQQPSNFLI